MEWELEIIGNPIVIRKRLDDVVKDMSILDPEDEIRNLYYPKILPLEFEALQKDHPREEDRAKRRICFEDERKQDFTKSLAEWYSHEKLKIENFKVEEERLKEQQENTKKLIQKDLSYSWVNEIKEVDKDPETYLKYHESRKKFRQKEIEEDILEKRKEEEEKKRELEVQMEIERIKKEQEEYEKKRLFAVVAENTLAIPDTKYNNININKIDITSPQAANNSQNLKKLFGENTPEIDNHQDSSALPKLDETLLTLMRDIGFKVRNQSAKEEVQTKEKNLIIENLNKEENSKELEQLKALFEAVPKSKKALYKYPIDYNLIERADIIERKIKPWISSKLQEYLGTDEDELVKLIIKKVKKQTPPQQIQDRLEIVFEKDAETLVMKLWKSMIFETLKLKVISKVRNQVFD